jgi:transposase InsO family protein
LDGYGRYIVHCDLRESPTEADIEIILPRAKELHPEARPRIIYDNGPQFIARDSKESIRISCMTHVRTSPFYPQSNGKIERWHKSLTGNAAVAGRFVGSTPREEPNKGQSPDSPSTGGEADYFRVADDPGVGSRGSTLRR